MTRQEELCTQINSIIDEAEPYGGIIDVEIYIIGDADPPRWVTGWYNTHIRNQPKKHCTCGQHLTAPGALIKITASREEPVNKLFASFCPFCILKYKSEEEFLAFINEMIGEMFPSSKLIQPTRH